MNPARLVESAHILVVDDEDILRSILRFMLEDGGFQVSEAPSGNAAWRQLNQARVDLVISDIRMDDGDGLELLDRIRRKDTRLPIVILMTGYSDISEGEALNRGAIAMFQKPFDHQKLLNVVREALTKFAPQRFGDGRACPTHEISDTSTTAESA